MPLPMGEVAEHSEAGEGFPLSVTCGDSSLYTRLRPKARAKRNHPKGGSWRGAEPWALPRQYVKRELYKGPP